MGMGYSHEDQDNFDPARGSFNRLENIAEKLDKIYCLLQERCCNKRENFNKSSIEEQTTENNIENDCSVSCSVSCGVSCDDFCDDSCDDDFTDKVRNISNEVWLICCYITKQYGKKHYLSVSARIALEGINDLRMAIAREQRGKK